MPHENITASRRREGGIYIYIIYILYIIGRLAMLKNDGSYRYHWRRKMVWVRGRQQ